MPSRTLSTKPNGHAGLHDRANGTAERSAASANPDPHRVSCIDPHRVQSIDPYRVNCSDPYRVNGHAPASLERGGISMPATADRHGDHAASDDVSGATAAIAANASLAAATVRETYAEVAPSRANGAAHGAAQGTENGTTNGTEKKSKEGKPKGHAKADKNSHAQKRGKISPGEGPLPANPGEFVEEIHSRIDLFEVWQNLLESEDDKIRQRAVEKLTEMRYKGVAALADEPQQIIIDIDSAVATHAAEGASK